VGELNSIAPAPSWGWKLLDMTTQEKENHQRLKSRTM
jgi:hypothetical protein